MKRLLLSVLAAISFLVGYAGVAEAWPVYGRSEHHGYFRNIYDNWGDSVWLEGIPTSVNSATEFINYTKWRLNSGNAQQRVGASFIIQTMIGSARNNPATAAQVAEWEDRVRYAEAKGLVQWNVNVSYRLNSYYQGLGSGSNPVDDAFYEHSDTRTASAIRFRNESGAVVYQLRHECANPVGVISPVQDPPRYTITGRTTVTDTTLFPGQSVTFRHYLRNSGPSSATIGWTTRDGNTNGAITSGSNGLASGSEVNVNTQTFTVPLNAAFGTQYCRYISFAPSVNGLGSGQGAEVCATVVPDFEAVPTIVPPATTAQQGETITFTYRVQITGNTRSTNMACQVAGHNPGPGYTSLPAQDADRNPKVSPQPSLSCNQEFAVGGPYTVGSESVNVGNAAPGSRICRSFVINPRNEGGGYRSSAEICVVIAKSPYVHFMGNDVWAGGGFAAVNPSCSTSSKIQTVARTLGDGSVAGSASEYGAFALGRILTFGSANKALINPTAVAGKALTFSNVDNNNLGNYGAPQHCINDYVAKYDKATNDSAAADIDVSGQANGTVLNLSGPRTFRGDMPAGSQQVYLVEGDVTIAANMRYPANYNGIGEIPSLIIIATGNITVNRDVEQMDGLFVTRGNFFTCDVPVATTLSVNAPCEKQLTVNGAVIAGRLQLLRTFGAQGNNDSERKRPAEVFNFNSEMYLRSALSGTNANVLRTVDQRDLPPRF